MDTLDEYGAFATGIVVGMGAGFCLGWYLQNDLRKSPKSDPGQGDDTDNTHMMGEVRDFKMVLVVRNDLKMGKGKIAAQCSHAAVATSHQLLRQPDLLMKWNDCGQPKVVLKAPDESSLLELFRQAKEAKLPVSLIRDAGRTQIVPGTLTVLGVGPGPSEDVDAVTGHLKLL